MITFKTTDRSTTGGKLWQMECSHETLARSLGKLEEDTMRKHLNASGISIISMIPCFDKIIVLYTIPTNPLI